MTQDEAQIGASLGLRTKTGIIRRTHRYGAKQILYEQVHSSSFSL
jgi:hypothetical protein